MSKLWIRTGTGQIISDEARVSHMKLLKVLFRLEVISIEQVLNAVEVFRLFV